MYIKNNVNKTDTRIEWFKDGAWSTVYDGITVAGPVRGKVMVSGKELTVTDGQLHVRITKPGKFDDGTIGGLVIYYFPYVD